MSGSIYMRLAGSILIRIAIALALLGSGHMEVPVGRDALGDKQSVVWRRYDPSPAHTEGIGRTEALLRDASGAKRLR
jgi:hypothetical protein